MIQFIFQYCFNFVKCLPIGLLMHGGDGHTVMAFESQSNDPQQIPPMISPFLYAQGWVVGQWVGTINYLFSIYAWLCEQIYW